MTLIQFSLELFGWLLGRLRFFAFDRRQHGNDPTYT
jgi:hypothetical protein